MSAGQTQASDTPETDAKEDGHCSAASLYGTMLCHARNLERERDNLREWKRQALIIEAWWKQIDTYTRAHPSIILGEYVSHKALELLKSGDALAQSVLDWWASKSAEVIVDSEGSEHPSVYDEPPQMVRLAQAILGGHNHAATVEKAVNPKSTAGR